MDALRGFVGRFADRDGRRRGVRRAVAAAVLCAVGGWSLLGLPGAVVFELSRPLLRLVHGPGAGEEPLGDNAWPLALYISALWPVGIVLGAVAAGRVPQRAPRAVRPAVGIAVAVAWALGVAVALYPGAR